MRNISIGRRLALGFGLILVLVIALSLEMRSILVGLQRDVRVVVLETMPKVRIANDIITVVNENSTSIRNLILADNEAVVVREISEITRQRQLVVAKYDTLQKSLDTDVERQAYADILKTRQAFVPFQEGMMRLVENKDGVKARALLFGEYQRYQDDYMRAVGRLLAVEDSIAHEKGAMAEANVDMGVILLVVASLLLIILGIFIAVYITRSVVIPVRECMNAAHQIAEGNMNIQCAMRADDKSETGQLSAAIRKMSDSIRAMVGDVQTLSVSVRRGHLLERIELNGHKGEFRKMLEGVNATVSSMVSILDAVPSPVSVVNANQEFIYINKAGADLGNTTAAALVDSKQRSADFYGLGKNTEHHSVVRAMRNNRLEYSETQAHCNEKVLDIHYTGVPVTDESGKVVGGLEVLTDLTVIKNAQRTAARISAYQDSEVNRLTRNLEAISRGDLDCDFTVAEGDSDTKEVQSRFETLLGSLRQSVQAIRALTQDVNLLSNKSVQGNLSYRAEVSRHQGDYRKIIEGVNQTLDAVLAPISDTAQVLEKISQRDLTARVSGQYQGDHARITQALNVAVDNLEKALIQVNEGAVQVSSAAQQISAGSQSLAQGANEQASSLEEISSSLEELSSMTRLNAENAGLAKSLASETDSKAMQGTQAMNRMSGAIERIKDSSDATAKIIKTIDEIAMQTNLLALNAAVEAARAGDAGRGFAVVAEEVRNLAQRSAQAAKNTADMIGESVRNAEDGVLIAQEVSASFTAIASSVGKVNSLIAEIAGASQEQSSSLQQVNGAVSDMDKVTQQNAANAEESASASEELSSQSEELQAMVGQFRVSLNHNAYQSSATQRVTAKLPSASRAFPKVQKVLADETIPLDNESLRRF